MKGEEHIKEMSIINHLDRLIQYEDITLSPERKRYSITITGTKANVKKVITAGDSRQLSYHLSAELPCASDVRRFACLIEEEFGWEHQEDFKEESWSDRYDLDDESCPDFGIMNVDLLDIQSEYTVNYLAGKLTAVASTMGEINLVLYHPPEDTRELDQAVVRTILRFTAK